LVTTKSQPTISPASPQQGTIALTHATIHIGNGDVLQDGMIVFSNGKIINVGATTNVADAKVIDCSGKQIYPGLFLPTQTLD
jgi:imidazolonepropionase-like amidohydrolase